MALLVAGLGQLMLEQDMVSRDGAPLPQPDPRLRHVGVRLKFGGPDPDHVAVVIVFA
jgi:hypothetical protein